MGRWEAPRDFQRDLASREDVRAMSSREVQSHTCRWCRTVYRTLSGRRNCQDWHARVFRRMRSDAARVLATLAKKTPLARADKQLQRDMQKVLRETPEP